MNVLIAEGNNDRIARPMMVKPENDYLTLSEKCRLAELAVEVGVALTRAGRVERVPANLRRVDGETLGRGFGRHLDA